MAAAVHREPSPAVCVLPQLAPCGERSDVRRHISSLVQQGAGVGNLDGAVQLAKGVRGDPAAPIAAARAVRHFTVPHRFFMVRARPAPESRP
jgi:hypothetical protein